MKRTLRLPVWVQSLDLSMTAKILLAEIESLHRNKGCFASNSYLAELLGIEINTVAKNLAILRKKGFLQTVSFDGRKRVMVPVGVGEGETGGEGKERFVNISNADRDENPSPIFLNKNSTKKHIKEKETKSILSLENQISRFSPSTRKMISDHLSLTENGSWKLKEGLSKRMTVILESILIDERGSRELQ
ncbi:helix-turn-helix domain-containing protein [Leptospira sp. 'Mane']|uniref:helix-turn-helix domain-containing protein n=1 Tax=Leptospira sp. 'Mane' TaxID=3387407 RepID=UPI00398A7F6C